MVKCLECWAKEFGVFSEEQWGATERQRWNEDWVGGATQRGREIREEAGQQEDRWAQILEDQRSARSPFFCVPFWEVPPS